MEGIIYQILNLLIVIVPILSLVLCRIYYPNKFWVAMVFSVVFFPIGHFYIKKGIGYVFIILLNFYLLSLVVDNEIILITSGCLISAIFMYFRFKIMSIKQAEQIS